MTRLYHFKFLVASLILTSSLLLSAYSSAQSPDESLAGAVIVQPKETLPVKVDQPIAPTDESKQLAQEITDLKNLLLGQLPESISIEALFEVDLQDEVAVSQRINIIKERLSSDNLVNPQVAIENDIRYMRIERAKLRLAFLSLPKEQRISFYEQDRLKQREKDLIDEQKTSAAELANSELARDSALTAAKEATDEIERTLATEEARLLAHLSELASLRQSWVNKNQQLLSQHQKLMLQYNVSNAKPALKEAEADILYEQIRVDLRAIRKSADDALKSLHSPFTVSPLQSSLDINEAKFKGHPQALARIRQLRGKITVEEANLQIRESRERYAHTDEIMRTLRTLQARRVSLLSYLSEEKKNEVTGFSADGWARIVSEATHVQLMIRWYPIERLHEAKGFANLLKNVFEASKFGIEVLGLLFIITFLLFSLRHSRSWLNQLRVWLSKQILNHAIISRVDNAMQLLIRISNELIVLLSVYILFDHLLQSRLGITELAVLRYMAYAYAFYTLAIAFIHRILLVAVSRYRVVEAKLNEKILRSLKLIARVILFFVMYLIIAKAMLGEGALYGIAKQIAVFFVWIVGWLLIRDWRAEVTLAYLNIHPVGRLAELVRASHGKSHGLLIATAAFVFVAARGLVVWLRDSALSFEQTRKALAYLFRRKLERQSKKQATAPDPSLLPQELTDALTEDVALENLCINYYPHIEEVIETANEILNGKQGMFIAVKGERGSGKTTWLKQLERQLVKKLPLVFHSLEKRITTSDEICLLLSKILGLAETTNKNVLIAQLLEKESQVVIIDLGQNLMLRDVGGLVAYDTLVKIAQATAPKILWVVSFSRWAFDYLQRTQPGRDIYDKVIELQPWSERRIAELLETRLMMSGFVADYDQLLLSGSPQTSITSVRGSRASNQVSMEAVDAVEKIADRYYRLIWDYADGNPRVALHFFRLSLISKGDARVSVQLFPLPSMNELETFEKRTHYLLACLVQHENLTIQEASSSLRFPEAECSRAFQLLLRDGFVFRNEEGVFRVTSHWSRAVLRFLHRKKLLTV